MAEEQSPYKSSTEQERFSRQLERDINRPSNIGRIEEGKTPKLSSSVISRLINEETRQWATSIANQKLANNNSGNIATQATRETSANTTRTQSSKIDDFQQPQSNSSAFTLDEPQEGQGGGGGTLPPTMEVVLCVDGEAKEAVIYGFLK